jgi:serine protease
MVAAAALACLLAAPSSSAAPARPTGRWLVVMKNERVVRSSSALSAVLARTGVRRAGRGVPQLRVATVSGPDSAIRRLRRDRAVESVSREWERPLRRMPNDPALSTVETDWGGASGAPIQWALARERFPRAWDISTGPGARVAVLDTGVDAGHPELRGKIATADAVGTTNPGYDPDGHGTHTSGLACAATNNGLGIAGAGFACRLNVVKLGLTTTGGIVDEEIADGIRLAADRGADAISMSFGGGPPTAVVDLAIDYALRRGAVLVAAASNDDTTDQGAPASQLQPGDAPNIDAGRGLVVTAADFSDHRPGTGRGNQISLAAYGFYSESSGPPGLISTYPGTQASGDTECDPIVLPTCTRREINGDDRYEYLEGTSMSTPQVAALAALVSDLNPYLSVREKLRLIKQTARRSGGWSSELGWGIIDAGRALDAARLIDHRPPSSRARARHRLRVHRGGRRIKARLRWSGSDPAGRPQLVPSGLRSFAVYMKRGRGHYRRLRRATRGHLLRLRLRPGVYRFYTRAVDSAGNREAVPHHADARLVVKRPRRR